MKFVTTSIDKKRKEKKIIMKIRKEKEKKY